MAITKTHPVQSDQKLDTDEAALYLGLRLPKGRRMLEAMRVNKRGPRYLKVGRLCRYRVADLDAYLKTCERTTADSK